MLLTTAEVQLFRSADELLSPPQLRRTLVPKRLSWQAEHLTADNTDMLDFYTTFSCNFYTTGCRYMTAAISDNLK